MTRARLAILLTLALLALAVFGAVAGTAGLAAILTGADRVETAEIVRAAPRDVLLDGESEAVAASSLQSRVRSAAERAGIRLTRIEIRPPEDVQGPLAALIEARGTNDQIIAFLHDLESDRPAILTHESRLSRAEPLESGQTHSELILSAEFRAWHGRMGPDA